MKGLKSCTFGKVYRGLPGLCIMLTFAIAIVITGSLGYLFLTQEVFKDPSSNSLLPMALRPTQNKVRPVEHQGTRTNSGLIPVADVRR